MSGFNFFTGSTPSFPSFSSSSSSSSLFSSFSSSSSPLFPAISSSSSSSSSGISLFSQPSSWSSPSPFSLGSTPSAAASPLPSTGLLFNSSPLQFSSASSNRSSSSSSFSSQIPLFGSSSSSSSSSPFRGVGTPASSSQIALGSGSASAASLAPSSTLFGPSSISSTSSSLFGAAPLSSTSSSLFGAAPLSSTGKTLFGASSVPSRPTLAFATETTLFGSSSSSGVPTSTAAAVATSSSSTAAVQTSSSVVVASSSGTTSTVTTAVAPAPKIPSEITGKIVEEIIKEWNTELQERTGKFREQATAIAEWDKKILQNRDVLLRLEIEVAKVVETQAQLDRQLELIKTHQQKFHKTISTNEGGLSKAKKPELVKLPKAKRPILFRSTPDIPVPSLDAVRTILDHWKSFAQPDAATHNMWELYPISKRVEVQAGEEKYFAHLPSHLDDNSYEQVLADGMHLRNHTFDESAELAVTAIRNMTRQHKELFNRLEDADILRSYVVAEARKQEELEDSLELAKDNAQQWEDQAKASLDLVVAAKKERDTARTKAQATIATAIAAAEAKAQAEEALARAKEALARAEEARSLAETTNTRLESERTSLLLEVATAKDEASALRAEMVKEKANLQENYHNGLKQIFRYGYGCCVFKHGICNDEPEVPEGMPNCDAPLAPEFFVKPQCPSEKEVLVDMEAGRPNQGDAIAGEEDGVGTEAEGPSQLF